MSEKKINRNLIRWGYASSKPTLSVLKDIRRQLKQKYWYPVTLYISESGNGYWYYRGLGFNYRNLPKCLRKTFRQVRQQHNKIQGDTIPWNI